MYSINFNKKIEKQPQFKNVLRDCFVKPAYHVKKNIMWYIISFFVFTLVGWIAGDFNIKSFHIKFIAAVLFAALSFIVVVLVIISAHVYSITRIKTSKMLGILNDNYTDSHVMIYGNGVYSVVKNVLSIIISFLFCCSILLLSGFISVYLENMPIFGESLKELLKSFG